MPEVHKYYFALDEFTAVNTNNRTKKKKIFKLSPKSGILNFEDNICDPFWHSESNVARAEYLVSPIMP